MSYTITKKFFFGNYDFYYYLENFINDGDYEILMLNIMT